jgi:hypothetical protein
MQPGGIFEGGYAEGNIITNDIILLLDKDSGVKERIMEAVIPEFAADEKLAYVQCATSAVNLYDNYYSYAIGHQINNLFHNIWPCKALQGFFLPLVGHNVFLRKSLLEKSGLWAENRVSEDFDKAIHFYSIVTCEDDVFANNMVTIPASRALTKYIVPSEIFERCSTLSETGIEELKRFPAIICRENTELKGVTDPNQWAMFAYIKAVRVSGKNVKIVFNPIAPIQQLKLCDKRNAVFFDLNMDCAVTDLNHSAWSVHKVNVFEAFDEAQIPGIPRPM